MDDTWTTGPRGGFKFGSGLPEELKNVPALDAPLREMVEIQHERMQLARQRQFIAGDRSRPSGVIMREFHELLRREDELTSRQRSVMERLVGDLDVIQDQVAKRREALRREMESAPAGEPGEGRSPAEARRLWRALRFYDTIGSRLETLAKDPDRQDALRTLLRGGLDTEGLDSAGVETLRNQLREVRQQQERLQRKMHELEQQIDEMSDVLDALDRERPGKSDAAVPKPNLPTPPTAPAGPTPAPPQP